MSLIKIEDICAGYGEDNIIENISFNINAGEIVGILGANGSGKSTLEKAVCNVLSHSGNVIIDGLVIEELNVSRVANIISYIPQNSGIGIDISVFDVVMMGFNPKLGFWENPNQAMKEQAKAIIDLLGLSDKIDSNFMQLSEGQKQLAIIARALVSDGKLLVMDEPESALDFNVRYNIMKILRKWIECGSRSGLIILHDIMLALNNCDRLVLLKDKHIIGVVDLHNDAIETIESKLSMVYGDISLAKIASKKGKDSYVMICDAEDV